MTTESMETHNKQLKRGTSGYLGESKLFSADQRLETDMEVDTDNTKGYVELKQLYLRFGYCYKKLRRSVDVRETATVLLIRVVSTNEDTSCVGWTSIEETKTKR
jgi:hypothetical protein